MRVAYFKLRNWFKGIVIRFRYESYALHLVRTRKYLEFYEHLSFAEKRSYEDVRKLLAVDGKSYRQWQVLVALRVLEAIRLAKQETELRDVRHEGELYQPILELILRLHRSSQAHVSYIQEKVSGSEPDAELSSLFDSVEQLTKKLEGPIMDEIDVFTKLPRGRKNPPRLTKLRFGVAPAFS